MADAPLTNRPLPRGGRLSRPVAAGGRWLRCLASGLALVVGACAPPPDAGAPRLVDGPRRGPPRAIPRPPPASPPPAPAEGRAPPPARLVPPAGPAPAPSGPPLAAGPLTGPLPPAWPTETLAVVADRLQRRVLASEQPVGLAGLPGGGLIALSAEGGLFSTVDWRPLRAQRTPLPPEGFTALHAAGDQLLACRPAGAWESDDAGQRWRPAGFGCGLEGRHDVALQADRRLRLSGGRLLVERLPGGALLAEVPLGLLQPEVVVAFDQTVVVFGQGEVARSLDGGLSFHAATRDDGGALAVVGGQFVHKSRAVAVGVAAPDAAQALVSADGGLRWRSVPLPRRAERLSAVAADGTGRIRPGPSASGGAAVLSEDGGARWAALADRRPVLAAVWGQPWGFEATTPDGISLDLSGVRPPRGLGLSQPLFAVAVTHPLVAVGAGIQGGLFQSRDGGRSFGRVPGTEGVRFADVTRVAGHRVVAVGDGVLWVSADGGARFARIPPPVSCQARWARFSTEGLGLVACADGATLRSEDGGASYRPGPRLPEAVGPVAWSGPRGLAVRADGAGLVWTLDGGQRFVEGPGPGLDLVDAQATEGGFSVAAADGRIWWSLEPAGPWVARFEAPLGPCRAHRWVAEGLLRLGVDQLWLHRPASPARPLGPAAGDRLALVGDGGVWILGDHATVALEPGPAD